jgi:hypothetical protein
MSLTSDIWMIPMFKLRFMLKWLTNIDRASNKPIIIRRMIKHIASLVFVPLSSKVKSINKQLDSIYPMLMTFGIIYSP